MEQIRGIRDKTKQLKTKRAEMLEIWKEHYEQKFKREEEIVGTMKEDTQKDTTEEIHEIISMKELQEALSKIKVGKVNGADRIDPEMIKYFEKVGKEWLLGIIKEAWKTKVR